MIKRTFPVAIATTLGVRMSSRADIVGPLCTPLDSLARALPVAPPDIGDLLGIFQSGAYGLAASPIQFLAASGGLATATTTSDPHHRSMVIQDSTMKLLEPPLGPPSDAHLAERLGTLRSLLRPTPHVPLQMEGINLFAHARWGGNPAREM